MENEEKIKQLGNKKETLLNFVVDPSFLGFKTSVSFGSKLMA